MTTFLLKPHNFIKKKKLALKTKKVELPGGSVIIRSPTKKGFEIIVDGAT